MHINLLNNTILISQEFQNFDNLFHVRVEFFYIYIYDNKALCDLNWGNKESQPGATVPRALLKLLALHDGASL